MCRCVHSTVLHLYACGYVFTHSQYTIRHEIVHTVRAWYSVYLYAQPIFESSATIPEGGEGQCLVALPNAATLLGGGVGGHGNDSLHAAYLMRVLLECTTLRGICGTVKYLFARCLCIKYAVKVTRREPMFA